MGIKSVIFQQLSRNHIGKKCVEERDPYKVRELDGVNTQACEQLFRDVNKHSNCQAKPSFGGKLSLQRHVKVM